MKESKSGMRHVLIGGFLCLGAVPAAVAGACIADMAAGLSVPAASARTRVVPGQATGADHAAARPEDCPASTRVPTSPPQTSAAAQRPRPPDTPWRFEMSQNGKRMTADEFSAWLEARGVRVVRGAAGTAAPTPAAAEPDPRK